MHLGVIKEFLSEDELAQVVAYHYNISQGLGYPVGLINMYYRVPPNENEVAYTSKYPVENLYDRVQNIIVQLLEKTHMNLQSPSANGIDDMYADEDIGAMMA